MYRRVHIGINMQRAIFLVLLLLLSIISVLIINAFQPTTTQSHIRVPHLVPAWSYTSGGSKITSSPVVLKGMAYLSSLNRIDAVETTSGIKRWSFTSSDGNLSSPTAINGIVYTYSSRYRRGTIYALDAASGVEKWHFAMNMSDCGLSPVVNGVIYGADNNTGILYALDAISGSVRWRYTVGDARCSRLTVAERAVYISTLDSSGNNMLNALNAASGVKLWSYPLRADPGTSPIFTDGMIYIVLAYQDDLMVLDALSAETGTKQWSYTTEGALTMPIVMKGTIYIGSVESDPLKGNGRLSLHALSAASGNQLWSYQVGSHVTQNVEFSDISSYGTFTPLAAINGVVYADLSAPSPGGAEVLYALNAASGNQLWSSHLGVRDGISSSLVVANGIIYASTAHWGKLYALSAQSGAQLLSYLMTDPPQFAPVVVNNTAYFTTTIILYAFSVTLKETSLSPSSLKTTIFSPARSLASAPVPVANKAPVFADVSGLHIQSTDNIQCSKTLVLASDRLTYSQDELQQMRNYLHQLASANAPTATPPSTLRWVPGSEGCNLSLQISNTSDTPIQLHSIGVQLISTPRDNSDQRFRMINFCSVASQEDANFFSCRGLPGTSGGGACSLIGVDITLKADAAPASFFTAPLTGGDESCLEPTLHLNDTIDIDMSLTSPGKKPDSLAPYIYPVEPVIVTSDSRGFHTLSLTSMAASASFLSGQQFSCYALRRDTTFVLNNDSPCIQD